MKISPFQSVPLPAPLVQWWRTKSASEHRALAAAAGIAVIVAVWAIAWQPLTRDLAAMRAGHAQRSVALVEARRMTEEMAGLARAPLPAVPADDRANLERMLTQQGLRAAATELTWQDGRAHVVFGAITFDALIQMLETLQRDARLRVVEAVLTARVEPRMVRAELTLAR